MKKIIENQLRKRVRVYWESQDQNHPYQYGFVIKLFGLIIFKGYYDHKRQSITTKF